MRDAATQIKRQGRGAWLLAIRPPDRIHWHASGVKTMSSRKLPTEMELHGLHRRKANRVVVCSAGSCTNRCTAPRRCCRWSGPSRTGSACRSAPTSTRIVSVPARPRCLRCQRIVVPGVVGRSWYRVPALFAFSSASCRPSVRSPCRWAAAEPVRPQFHEVLRGVLPRKIRGAGRQDPQLALGDGRRFEAAVLQRQR